MRASELLGREVVRADGTHVGFVRDLRCVQDGPLRGALACPRVHALIVMHRRGSILMGYQREGQRGPAAIRFLARWWHRDMTVVPWPDVERIDDKVTLTAP